MKTIGFRRFSSGSVQIWTWLLCLFFTVGCLLTPVQAHVMLSADATGLSAQPSGAPMQQSEGHISAGYLISDPAVTTSMQHDSPAAHAMSGMTPCEEPDGNDAQDCAGICIHCAICSFPAMSGSAQPTSPVSHVIHWHVYPLREAMPPSPQRHPPYRPPIH